VPTLRISRLGAGPTGDAPYAIGKTLVVDAPVCSGLLRCVGRATDLLSQWPTRVRCQPLPRVLSTWDFESFEKDGDDRVFPAFDNAAPLDLPVAGIAYGLSGGCSFAKNP
jgi:hypothetical protein